MRRTRPTQVLLEYSMNWPINKSECLQCIVSVLVQYAIWRTAMKAGHIYLLQCWIEFRSEGGVHESWSNVCQELSSDD